MYESGICGQCTERKEVMEAASDIENSEHEDEYLTVQLGKSAPISPIDYG